MTNQQLQRINELAKKAKTPEGLTEDEKTEQAQLRRQYIDEWKRSVTATLDNTYVLDSTGKHKLQKKDEITHE